MNPALVTTFSAVAADLTTAFGGSMTCQSASAGDVACLGILEGAFVPVGEFGERMEYRPTITVLKSLDAQIGDTFLPEGSDVIWTATQVLEDDGYLTKFAVLAAS